MAYQFTVTGIFFSFQSKVVGGMNTLKDLILTRPEHRLRFLGILLESCSHEKPEVCYKLYYYNNNSFLGFEYIHLNLGTILATAFFSF